MFESLRTAFLLSYRRLIGVVLVFCFLTAAGAVFMTLWVFEVKGVTRMIIDGVVYLSAGVLLWLLPPLCSPIFASPGDLKAALFFPLLSSVLVLFGSGPVYILTGYVGGTPSFRAMESLIVSLLGVSALAALRFLLKRLCNFSYLITPLPFLAPWWVSLTVFGAVWTFSIVLISKLKGFREERRAGVWLISCPPFRSPF